MNKILIGFGVLLVAFSGYLIYDKSQDNTGIATPEEHDSFVWYHNDELGFSIQHPSTAEVSVEGTNGESVKFMVLGPETIANSEVTDGFTLTVTYLGATSTDLKTFAEERRSMMELNGSTDLSSPDETEVGSLPASRYTYTNLLGNESTEYIVLTPTGRAYAVTQSIMDPSGAGYAGLATRMLESLSFGESRSFNENGVSFRYPRVIGTYVVAMDWPPRVNVVDEDFSCVEAGAATERAGRTEVRRIDGTEYCVTEVVEAAAGSRYTQYAYVLEREAKTIILTFSTREPQCANFEPEEKLACEADQEIFNPDRIIAGIVESLEIRSTD